MLIEIDHIAISSMRFDEHIQIMKSIGYAQTFVETNIDNLQIKRPLLNRYNSKHDLALLNSVGNIGIELVNHRYIHEAETYIVPVFENIPSELIEDQGKKINEIGFYAKMKTFDMPIYISNNDRNSNLQFKKIVVKTKNITKSTQFWEFLGFKVIQTTPDLVLLEFRTLIHKNIYHLLLQKNNDDNVVHFLDDKGVNCIAFISSSIKNEKKFLDKNGVSTTDIEKFVLGKKILDIFFAKGPSSELIEIISVQNS